MTPTTLLLSRQIATLPGAPTRIGYGLDGRGVWLRDLDGWVLDLDDSMVGGFMLARLTVPVKVYTRLDPPGVRIVYLTEDGEGLGPRQSGTRWEATLAVAVARVIAERRRW